MIIQRLPKIFFCCIGIGIAAFFAIQPAHADDLGVVGDVYPIAEQDLLEYIHSRLVAMQENGQMQAMQSHMQDQAQAHADRPKPLSNLTRTQTERTFEFNPTIEVPYDLSDGQGHIFAKAGTELNPLAQRAFTETLIFYNADDSDQVNWAKAKHDALVKAGKKEKLILVGGSVFSQAKLFHEPVYFDQGGRITRRFGLEHVPAIAYQDGLRIKIEEQRP